MSREKKKLWQGDYAGSQPASPVLVLARHIDWQRAQNNRHMASCSYPEPINLTGASAWTSIPRDNLERTAIIYRCSYTNLWIKLVAVNEVPVCELSQWTQQQFDQGAVLVWVNIYAESARQQPCLNDLDTEPGTQNKGLDPLCLTVRLQQMDKYKIGDCDIIKILPEKFRFTDVSDTANLKKPAKSRSSRGKKGGGNCKPVETPEGIFVSATKAAEVLDVSVTWVTLRARKNKHGFKYISHEEYLLRNVDADINTETLIDSLHTAI
jgi:hypothetical protein